MGRIKEAQDALSKSRQRLDKPAAERFIKRNLSKSALWENSLKKAEEGKSATPEGKPVKSDQEQGARKKPVKHSSILHNSLVMIKRLLHNSLVMINRNFKEKQQICKLKRVLDMMT
jgi:hypothetical protein